MAKAPGGVRNDVIRCDNCGEDYSTTYKRCPFCDAKPGQRFEETPDSVKYRTFSDPESPNSDDEGDEGEFEPAYDDERPGKHLQNQRGGGYRNSGITVGKVLGLILSLAIIGAAIWVIVTQIVPKFKSDPPVVTPTPPISAVSPSPTATPTATPTQDPTAPAEPTISGDLPAVTGDPAVTPTKSPDPAVTPTKQPDPGVTPAPGGTLKLSSADFTLSSAYGYTNQMSYQNATGKVTWSSSNEAVATVTSGGLVTGLASGTATLTAKDEGGNVSKAIVRVSGLGSGASQDAPAQDTPTKSPATGSAALSSTDFTLSGDYGYTNRLTVSGATATAWSSSNTNVATVASDGTVTGVGKGTCTITASLDIGTKLKCVVRVVK